MRAEVAETILLEDVKKPTLLYTFDKVSNWFDTDDFNLFAKLVRSGDVVELRSTKSSHWGVAIRIPQPPKSPRSKAKQPKAVPDEIMIYHVVHSSNGRGQVGQFTVEEFWTPFSRIRINNTSHGASLNIAGNARLIPKLAILHKASMAHASTSLKWQTCAEFIRWCSEETYYDELRSTSGSSLSNSDSSSGNDI